jgi:hypothetical protein
MTTKQSWNMRLTERDVRILETIHAFDGMLAAYQIQQLFFCSARTTRERLWKLSRNGYLALPDRRQRAAIPHLIYWLTAQGAEKVAELEGCSLKEFKWRREPRWSQVSHDIAVNDVRISFVKALEGRADFQFGQWVNESEFRARPDTIEYRDADGRRTKRQMIPDGFIDVIRYDRQKEKWLHNRLLLEVDMRTEDNPRFGREKARPGVAYFESAAYKQRFGYSSGRWLIVTTGERRLRNMKQQTELEAERPDLFYFTTFAHVTPETVLTAPIWWQGGDEKPRALFKDADPGVV